MMTFTFEDAEAQTLLNILANATGYSWAVTNPLLMKLGEQMRQQQAATQIQPPWNARPNGPDETAVPDVEISPDRRVPRR